MTDVLLPAPYNALHELLLQNHVDHGQALRVCHAIGQTMGGKHLPKFDLRRHNRDRRVKELWLIGGEVSFIAREVGLSERHVRRIIQADTKSKSCP